MFTGIIEEIGTIRRIQNASHSAVLHIQAKEILADMKTGDSIAVNGVCLTVTAFDGNGFRADVMHETLNRSSLASLKTGSHVNLERAMPANGRFGGHIVAGHVDGVGTILAVRRDGNAVWYDIQADRQIMKYIVVKGSVTIDGISLTVAKTSAGQFSISAIPHTVDVTILKERAVGDTVNLETDIIGKYVERFLTAPNDDSAGCPGQPEITREFLRKYGF